MKTHFVRFLALLLICATFSSAALTVSAAEVAPRASGQTSGLPFTLTPSGNVTGLYTSNRDGGYNFVPGKVTGSTIYVEAYLVHSSSTGQCKAGVCYSNNGTYVTAVSGSALSRNEISASIAKSSLNRDRTYYGFIKNNSSSGYISSGYVKISAK